VKPDLEPSRPLLRAGALSRAHAVPGRQVI